MQVEVLEAREIPRMDKLGTSDPSVSIFTDPKRKLETKTMKNTLNPVWDNELFYLMVQVPLPLMQCLCPHIRPSPQAQSC